MLARVDRWLLEMRPVTRWLAIGLLVSLTLLLTAWVCSVTAPEAPSQVPQPSDESKVVRGTDVPGKDIAELEMRLVSVEMNAKALMSLKEAVGRVNEKLADADFQRRRSVLDALSIRVVRAAGVLEMSGVVPHGDRQSDVAPVASSCSGTTPNSFPFYFSAVATCSVP